MAFIPDGIDGISFNAEPQTPAQTEGVAFGFSAPTLSDPVQTKRAARADFALGADSPGQQTLKDSFLRGEETQVRQQAAAKADADFRAEKLGAVQAMVKQGVPLTSADIDGLVNIGKTPEANPDTVFEDKFGKAVVTSGIAGDPGKNLVFQTAFDKVPERTTEGAQIASAAVSRKQQAQDVYEQTQHAYDNLPWVSFGNPDQQDKLGNLAQNVITGGIAQYVRQRNLVNAEPISGLNWLPGRNKLEQIQNLYLQPNFKEALMQAAGPGSKLFKEAPSEAVDFVKAAVSFSTSDSYAEDIMGVVNVGSLIPGSVFAKGLRAAKSESAVVQSASSVMPTAEKAAATGAKTAAKETIEAPTGPQYYIPEAAVKRPWESAPRTGEIRIENGVPRYFTDDGAEVVVSTKPEPGMIRVEAQEGTEQTRILTKRGTQEIDAEGNIAGSGQRTIYVNKKDAETLSQALDPDQRFTILSDDKGFHVGDLAKQGKTVKGSRVPKGRISDQPAEGLYPVHIPEGNDPLTLDNFGDVITRVDKIKRDRVKFGPTIVDDAEADARTALADIVKSQAYDHPQDVLSKMGMQNVASEIAAKQAIQQEATQTFPLGDLQAIRRNVPTNAQPVPYNDGVSGMSWKRAMEITNEFRSALGATRVERLPPGAAQVAENIAKDAVKKYNRVSADAIRDQATVYDQLSNVYATETKIGKPNGELFDSREQATHYKNLQYRMGSSAVVKQEGTKFYLSHTQHWDETQSAVRDAILLGNETPRPGLIAKAINATIGKVTGGAAKSLQSSAYQVSEFQRTARTTATHAPSFLHGAVAEEAKKLQDIFNGGSLTKAQKKEVEDMLVHNRDFIPPGGTGEDRGFFYGSRFEFEQAFINKYGAVPKEKQWEAYETYTRLSDLDWVLRESDNFKDKVRQGARNYNMKFTNREGQQVETGMFNGKEVADFSPLNTANANVYVVPENAFTTKYDLKDASVMSKGVMDKIKSGEYKIIQVYEPRSKPLSASTGIKEDIHFVVTNKFDETAIKWGENVPYRPGGHVIYTGSDFVKQPQIGPGTNGRLTHFGDVSLKAFETPKEAREWAAKYDQARLLLKAGDNAGFDAFVPKNLPETPAELRRMFADGTFNLDHPFMHTKSGRSTLQSNEAFVASNPEYKGLKDTFTSYNMAQNEEGAFLADRGVQLQTVANKGTEANPIYANVDAPLMDPYTSLATGLNQIVRSRWMSDAKTTAAEGWIQEFGHMFDQSKLPLEKMRQNPLYYLYHTDAVDKGVIANNPEAYMAMMTSRDAILRFIGSRDEVGAMGEALLGRAIEGIEALAGTKMARGAEALLPTITNIPQYTRTAAFHMVDGFWNPVQLIQQALGATHALAVSPKNGLNGLTAAGLTRFMRQTEDAAILGTYADKAAAMGWKKQDFMEAYQAWRESGIHNVGGEMTYLSNPDPALFKSAFGSFFDKGLYFFKRGEETTRDVAYFTAYKDWKDANPGRAFDNRAKTEVISRFDTLSMNMSRASNASWNEGLASLPTQFWSWNARFAEQMMTFGAGKQLTVPEKMRVAGANALLWGVPSTAGGVTLGLFPYANYDDIRQEAIKRGINLSDKFMQFLMEGLPTVMLNAVTGREISLHRFAPNADQAKIFQDIKTGKKDWPELIFGAAGSAVMKMAAATSPFWTYTMAAFSSDTSFPVKTNDFVNAAEMISSFNNGEKAWVGWNTGKYLAKNNAFQGEVDKFESVMMALGLNPQRINDAWQVKAILADQKSAKAKLEKAILEDYSLMLTAAQNNDFANMNDYAKRIKVRSEMGNFTEDERAKIFKRAGHGQDAMIDNVNKQWLRSGNIRNEKELKTFFDNLDKKAVN